MRFRVWMPLVAVAVVLLSVFVMLVYGIPATERRLSEYSQSYTFSRAAAVAEGLRQTDRAQWPEVLRAAGDTGGETQILVVDGSRTVVARTGPDLLASLPPGLLRAASEGERISDQAAGRRAAVVPLAYRGELSGGVIFVSDRAGISRIFLRGGIEAAAIALILAGGTALLLATLLSRRVERLTLGARAIESGDLSFRMEPGFRDELGELAASFNSMAARLQGYFDQIEESRETLGAILYNLSEGVLATDLDGGVVFMNRAAREMLGVEETSGEGETRDGGREPPYGPPERLPDPWEEFSLPRAVERCAQERECGEARVESGETHLQLRLEHLPAFDDHSGGVLVVVQDLSEGRRLEANQQRFLANAAHELKTPITALIGSAELLLTGEDDPETRRRFLGHIYNEALRMQRLSQTLLRLARTGADLREPRLEAVELSAVVAEALESIRPLAERSGVRLVTEGEGRARADAEWLEQALLSLLGNAIKHSGEGSEVRVELRERALLVRDRGGGIAEDELPYVFERFYRSAGAGEDSESFGLGLPICRELVEGMGGKVSLRSVAEEGTTVTIELPEADE